MDKIPALIAKRPILHLAKLYHVGDELPTSDPVMLDAWLDAGSAEWQKDPAEVEEVPADKQQEEDQEVPADKQQENSETIVTDNRSGCNKRNESAGCSGKSWRCASYIGS